VRRPPPPSSPEDALLDQDDHHGEDDDLVRDRVEQRAEGGRAALAALRASRRPWSVAIAAMNTAVAQ